MNNNIKRWLVASVCCFMLGCGQSIMAQQVIFPQKVQANKAQLESNINKWTLKNSLLTAKFAKVDGRLIFNGCKESVSGYVFCAGSDTETWFKRGELW